ncbi:MAG: serine/threonine-protein kinase [Myxococcota bacterium]
MDHPPHVDELIGRLVGDRFVVRELLARGAMGRVYAAEQVPLGRKVAVKFLDVGTIEPSQEWADRFRREAASLAALTSPHTVRIIDYGWWDGQSYLVMEFIEGEPLSALLKQGPLITPRALDFALQICDSLQEAHARGLVHRDLKPENLLLTHSADGREWIKVVDWGLVKDLRIESDQTEKGILLGTPAYMAPEQIRGDALDGRVDIYALGVTLFLMLTGKKPFDPRTTTAGILLTHLQEPPSELRDALPEGQFPEGLDNIIQRCLAKNRADRYSSAFEVARDLQIIHRHVTGDPITTTSLGSAPPRSLRSVSSISGVDWPTDTAQGRGWGLGLALGAAASLFLVALAAGVIAAWATRSPELVEVDGVLTGTNEWTPENIYVLTEPVFVEEGTLTIQAGTEVRGEEGSALVVTQTATVRAEGRPDAPVVFTSAQPVGQRAPGDWGGVVLLGSAPVNVGDGRIEGVNPEDPRGAYGGDDPESNCGVLEYVRIEFSGFEAWANSELNGLTLGGCGRRTIVRHVQVHQGLDDGVELFGGTADLSHVVITEPGDDGLDWDQGWRGRAQFIIVQLGDERGQNAIEADNLEENSKATPRSEPRLSHLTLLGSRNDRVSQRALVLRRGTAGRIENVVIGGFRRGVADVGDASTAELARQGRLTLGPGVMYGLGEDGRTPFPKEEDDDGGFIESGWPGALELVDGGTMDISAPDFTPPGHSPAARGATPLPDEEFWDAAATWLGATRPGTKHTWLEGWTAFPEN